MQIKEGLEDEGRWRKKNKTKEKIDLKRMTKWLAEVWEG